MKKNFLDQFVKECEMAEFVKDAYRLNNIYCYMYSDYENEVYELFNITITEIYAGRTCISVYSKKDGSTTDYYVAESKNEIDRFLLRYPEWKPTDSGAEKVNPLENAELVHENLTTTSKLDAGLRYGVGKVAVFFINHYISNPVFVYAKTMDDGELYIANGLMHYYKWDPEEGLLTTIGIRNNCTHLDPYTRFMFFVKNVEVNGDECTITYDAYRLN